ncbi:MAG TPA: hypothetical protein VMV44_16430 [Rectinemataceae bacterium]|nr:hypothetical protein [Rectinemataceae bacterium]
MSSLRRAGSIPALLILCSASLQALPNLPSSIAEWLGSPAAAAYAPIAAELEAMASTARSSGIPEIVLVERLQEGALKNIRPALLGPALRLDLGRFTAMRELLAHFDCLPGDTTSLASLLRQGAILMRAGYTDTELETILAATGSQAAGGGQAATGGYASDPEARGPRALRAAAVALDASGRFGLSVQSRLALGRALAASELSAKRFAELLSLLAKARGLGLSSDGAIAIIIQGLERGASLDALERDISRRTIKP